MPPLSWQELEDHRIELPDRVNGPTNAQARLRLFGASEADARVTLYRDHHAWCPYCQKVWLWLEEQRVPYRVEKVTMFCYGDKEGWYRERVPSGMLPALELDGELITESDVILGALEDAFGSLGPVGLRDDAAWPLRRLERRLFRAWCEWLCRPLSPADDEVRGLAFARVAEEMEARLADGPGPFLAAAFSTLDVIFTPYVERMNASLFYYKGYSLRQQHPRIGAWLDALEGRSTYRGTQSDFHTHVHDLPPQMGGCFSNGSEQARRYQRQVDEGFGEGLPEVGHEEPPTSRREALSRVLDHRVTLVRREASEGFEEALRAALTTLVTGTPCVPPAGTAAALRYLRDRISVPRDMSLYAARRLRAALETTAALDGPGAGPPIPQRHRRDQDPAPFLARGSGVRR